MSRYHIRRVKWHPESLESPERPYGIWDTTLRLYVNKWGVPDPGYWCATRAEAEMRRRDLNEYARQT